MDHQTKHMIRGWLAMHRGNAESLAKWMRDSLRLGSLNDCRQMICEAVQS